MTNADNDRCLTIRQQLMANLDGEDTPHDKVQSHLSTCEACTAYAARLESLWQQLQMLRYEPATMDIWPAVARAIDEQSADRVRPWRTDAGALAALGALVLVWRATQLLFDVPVPVLHALVPIALGAAAFRLLATNPIAIETSIPELHQERA